MNHIIEHIEADQDYDTNTINMLIVDEAFGNIKTDKLFRRDDELGGAIKALADMDTIKDTFDHRCRSTHYAIVFQIL